MTVPPGISIAPGQPPLTAVDDGDWFRIDDPADPAAQYVTGWSTHRGRAYLTDRTDAGTGTINFRDLQGSFDPTGSSLEPLTPASIALYNPVTDAWQQIYVGLTQGVPQTILDGAQVNTGTLPLADLFSLLANSEVPPGLDFPDSTTPTGGSNTTGNTTYAEQTVQDRIKALLYVAGVDTALTNIFSGNVFVQPTVYSNGYKILAALQDAADAEFPGVANIYVDKTGVVTFHGRLARFNTGEDNPYGIVTWPVGDAAACAADPTHTAILTSIQVDRTIDKVINNALFTPQGIADADVAAQLSVDAGSIAAYGVRSLTGQDLLTAGGETDGLDQNEETKLYSDFYVANFASPITAITQATFRIVDPSHPNAAPHWSFLCNVELNDLITVTTTHPGGGGFTAQPFFVEGISYQAVLGTLNLWDITMTLDLSPQQYFTTEPWTDPH